MSGLDEIDERTWNTLKKDKTKEILEVTQKDYDNIEVDRRIRIRELRRKLWEFKRERDMIERERQDGIILDALKRQYARDARIMFREYVRTHTLDIYSKGIIKTKLKRHDSYCWVTEIVGITKDGKEISVQVFKRVWFEPSKFIKP